MVCTLLPPSHPLSFHLTVDVAIRFLGCWVSSTPKTRGRCRDSRPPWYGTGLRNRNGYSRYAHGLTHIQGGSHFSCASLQYECVLWSLALKSGYFFCQDIQPYIPRQQQVCAHFTSPLSLSCALVLPPHISTHKPLSKCWNAHSPHRNCCVLEDVGGWGEVGPTQCFYTKIGGGVKVGPPDLGPPDHGWVRPGLLKKRNTQTTTDKFHSILLCGL